MKKTLWTLAATLALVGCSEKELINVDDGQLQSGNAIAFSTYVGDNALTRASVVEIDDIRVNGFGVNAYYTGTDQFSDEEAYSGNAIFMNNTKVTYNDGEWTYSPVKYWPNNDGEMLSFFAYAPYNSNRISFLNESNKSKLSFAVDADVKNQVDLIYHPADGNTTGCEKTIDLEKPSVSSKVNFNFQHALSRITFDVKAVVDEVIEGDNLLDGNTRINIKKVMLLNAAENDSESNGDGEGNVEGESGGEGENESPSEETGPFYTSASLDLISGEWDEKDGAQPFKLDDDHFYRGVKVDGVDVVQLTKFNPGQPLLNEDSYLMIIPQDFNAETGETSGGYRIYIEYDVISEEVDNNGNSENTTSDSNTITNKIYSPVMHTTFEAGKAYKFTLLLGMTSVKFEADVDDWDNATNDEVWLPENIPFTAEVDEDGKTWFLIQTAEELATFRDLINHGGVYVDENGQEQKYCYGNFKQMADIDLAEQFYVNAHGGHCFESIGIDGGDGNNPHQFVGTYDGQGYTVSNVNHDKDYMSGLFYKLDSRATIKNVRVEGTTTDSWAYWTGGVVGNANGATIINCHFTGSISISNQFNGSFPDYVGGVAGSSSGTIIACSNGGTVSATGSSSAGGIVGNGSTVKACYNYGDVEGSGTVGGIAGSAGTIVGCYNYATPEGIGSASSISYSYYNTESGISGYNADNSTVVTVADWETACGYMNYGLNQNSIGWHYEDTEAGTAYPLTLKEGSQEGTEPDDSSASDDEVLVYVKRETGLVHSEGDILIADVDDLIEARDLINELAYYLLDESSNKVYSVSQVSKAEATEKNDEIVEDWEDSIESLFNEAAYEQTADIDLVDVTWNTPIGIDKVGFSGKYDGGNHTISNLTITEETAYTNTYETTSGSLFYAVSSSEKYDFTIANIKMLNVQIDGVENAAAIATHMEYNVVIQNCVVGNSENDNSSIAGNSNAAGIIAISGGYSDIKECINYASISSGDHAAGITSGNYTHVTSSINNGTVTGAQAGGIIVYADRVSITNCRNNSSVSGSNRAGGIAYAADAAEITASFNTGTVNSEYGPSGGIIGEVSDDVKIVGCYNIGEVTGTFYLGSIIGRISLGHYYDGTSDKQKIVACYSTDTNISLIGKVAAPEQNDEGATPAYNMSFSGCYYVSDNAISSNEGNVSTDGTTKFDDYENLSSWTSDSESSPKAVLNNALEKNGSTWRYVAGESAEHPLKFQE